MAKDNVFADLMDNMGITKWIKTQNKIEMYSYHIYIYVVFTFASRLTGFILTKGN